MENPLAFGVDAANRGLSFAGQMMLLLRQRGRGSQVQVA